MTEKFSLMRAKASSNLVREIAVNLLNGGLRVLDGVEQIGALGFKEVMTLSGFGVLLERHHVDRAHRFEPALEAAAGLVFVGERFLFKARDVLLRAEFGGLDAEIADACAFEVLEVGSELGGVGRAAAAAFTQRIRLGAQRLQLLLGLAEGDAEQGGLFGPARRLGDGLLAGFGEQLLLGSERGILFGALRLLGGRGGELLF